MLKNLFVVLLLIVALAAGFVATRPSEFTIERGRTMAAPPEVVFGYVNDFRQWQAWSPWEKLDPQLKREYSDPSAGPGATYHWVGNDKVGEGRMTITDSSAPDSVTIRLEFVKPFVATNVAHFDIAAGGLGTDVTWSMSGHNDFMAKAFSLFMDTDQLVGGDFEKGLEQLDAVTAAVPRAAPAPAPSEAPPAAE